MLFRWLKNRRRTKLLAHPFPEAWDSIIAENVLHVRQLNDAQRSRLRRLMQVFVKEKNWEGCRGLQLTDEIKVTIAAQACLLVVGLPEDTYFDHVLSILVYPSAYVAEGTQITRAGVVMDKGQARLGEAWWRGPVILSWPEVLSGGRMQTPGSNLVLHEFAHQLDMMNGRFCDGMPVLETAVDVDRWISVLEPEYDHLVEACSRGHRGFLDCYGATNPAEFFAVLTETFFERPESLINHHPEVYDVVKSFYQLNPAQWEHEAG